MTRTRRRMVVVVVLIVVLAGTYKLGQMNPPKPTPDYGWSRWGNHNGNLIHHGFHASKSDCEYWAVLLGATNGKPEMCTPGDVRPSQEPIDFFAKP